MKQSSLSLFMGVLACASVSTTALAATHSAKMTCEEFIGLDEVSRPKAVYWAEGFNRKGKVEDEVIDFDRNDSLVPVLVDECTKTPKTTFISKVKAECKKKKT